MELTPTMTGWLVIVAILLGVAALAVGIVSLTGQRRVKRAYHTFSMGSRDDVLTLLQRHIDEVGLLRSDVRGLRRYADEIRELHRDAVSRVGTVRYDAFDDMGGRLSFSTALLDERGNGVVLTAINGRTDTRSYAKPVLAWKSRHNLSSEEEEAIQRARTSPASERSGKPRPVDPPTADDASARPARAQAIDAETDLSAEDLPDRTDHEASADAG